MSGGGPPLDVEVIAGGRPDAATTTAIALAIRAVGRAGSAAARPATTTPGWRRAALREGVGGRPEVRPDGRG